MNEIVGPFAYENWIASTERESTITYEYPLFTDATVIGTVREGLGPYELLNTVTQPHQRKHHPSIILRSQEFLDNPLPDMTRTEDGRYHGGLLNDEIASLISLCMGIRLKSGNASRIFNSFDDPKGHPTAGWGFSSEPLLPEISGRPVLPKLLGKHSIERVGILATLPNLSPSQAIALVRSARLYQDAVWIAETSPELSWIMLVSAVETIAGIWRAEKESNVERLRVSRPELEKLLKKQGGDEFVELVAEQIAPYMGATKTFIDFILEFLPLPPEKRPARAFRHPWNKKDMKKSMGVIYRYRSRALHGGKPFPAPMCRPPDILQDNIELEIPTGLAKSALGAVWVAKDIPMLLHTFEYIVRNSILKWWASQNDAQPNPASN